MWELWVSLTNFRQVPWTSPLQTHFSSHCLLPEVIQSEELIHNHLELWGKSRFYLHLIWNSCLDAHCTYSSVLSKSTFSVLLLLLFFKYCLQRKFGNAWLSVFSVDNGRHWKRLQWLEVINSMQLCCQVIMKAKYQIVANFIALKTFISPVKVHFYHVLG